MAVVMSVNGDPDGTLVNVGAFGALTMAIGWLTVRLYLPLFRRGPAASAGLVEARTTASATSR